MIPASRADFGIPQSAFVVGSFGFLLKHKGIAELVSALPLIRSSTGKDVRLLLVNAFHDEIGGLKEKQRIDALIRSLNIGRWVVWMNEFLPIEQSKSYLAMADLLAFPYQHTFESSSAAVRMAISCDRPIVTTPLHIFSDFQTFVLRTRDMSVQNLAETISSAVRRPEQLTTNLSNQRSWADSMSWSRTGRRWEGMIKGCLTDHKSKLI